jgi:hypothetical protein
MGPIIRLPADVAQRLAEETDLVEVDPVLPDAVDEIDVELGSPPGVIVLLVETPKDGFGRLVSMIVDSGYAKSHPKPFELTVRDKEGNPHAFSSSFVDGQSIQDHLKLAYYGEPGDRRPLIRA